MCLLIICIVPDICNTWFPDFWVNITCKVGFLMNACKKIRLSGVRISFGSNSLSTLCWKPVLPRPVLEVAQLASLILRNQPCDAVTTGKLNQKQVFAQPVHEMVNTWQSHWSCKTMRLQNLHHCSSEFFFWFSSGVDVPSLGLTLESVLQLLMWIQCCFWQNQSCQTSSGSNSMWAYRLGYFHQTQITLPYFSDTEESRWLVW